MNNSNNSIEPVRVEQASLRAAYQWLRQDTLEAMYEGLPNMTPLQAWVLKAGLPIFMCLNLWSHIKTGERL